MTKENEYEKLRGSYLAQRAQLTRNLESEILNLNASLSALDELKKDVNEASTDSKTRRRSQRISRSKNVSQVKELTHTNQRKLGVEVDESREDNVTKGNAKRKKKKCVDEYDRANPNEEKGDEGEEEASEEATEEKEGEEEDYDDENEYKPNFDELNLEVDEEVEDFIDEDDMINFLNHDFDSKEEMENSRSNEEDAPVLRSNKIKKRQQRGRSNHRRKGRNVSETGNRIESLKNRNVNEEEEQEEKKEEEEEKEEGEEEEEDELQKAIALSLQDSNENNFKKNFKNSKFRNDLDIQSKSDTCHLEEKHVKQSLKRKKESDKFCLSQNEIDALFLMLSGKKTSIYVNDLINISESNSFFWSEEDLNDMVYFFSGNKNGQLCKEDFLVILEKCGMKNSI